LKTAIMTFINAITFAPVDIDLRVQLIKELNDINFKDIILKLAELTGGDEHDADTKDLETQMNIFESQSEEDKTAMKKKISPY